LTRWEPYLRKTSTQPLAAAGCTRQDRRLALGPELFFLTISDRDSAGLYIGMSAPLIDPEHPPPALLRPAPLTFAKRDGTPYTRFDDVEKQISELLAHPVARWPHLILTGQRSPWRPQTLVHVARLARGDERVFGQLVYEIIERAGPVVAKWAQGYNSTTFELIAGEVTKKLVELIMAQPPTRTSEYLEIDFQKPIKQATLRVAMKYEDEPKAFHAIAAPANEDETSDPIENLKDEATLNPLDTLIERGRGDLLRKLLKAVTDRRHRKAFILRELRGWPMSSPDPAVPCLSTHFSPTSTRQIQNWINNAKEQMRAAYGETQ
jgi:hypothetical protein